MFTVSYLKWLNKTILFDVDTGEAKFLFGESGLCFSSDCKNYASIYSKESFWTPRRGSATILKPSRTYGRSEALRYNSFWIYPSVVKGFTSSEEALSLNFGTDVEERFSGIGTVTDNLNYVFSTPSFIGNTPWVGVFEWVFHGDNNQGPVSSNVVLVNAEKVSTNPPKEQEVLVRKTPFDLDISFRDTDYVDERYRDLRYNTHAHWNAASGCLELWKSTGWSGDEGSRQLVLTAPVDLEEMRVESVEVLHSGDSLQWSAFAH